MPACMQHFDEVLLLVGILLSPTCRSVTRVGRWMERLQARSCLSHIGPACTVCMQHFDEVLLARAFAKVSELDGRSRGSSGNNGQAHAFEGVRQGCEGASLGAESMDMEVWIYFLFTR